MTEIYISSDLKKNIGGNSQYHYFRDSHRFTYCMDSEESVFF